MNKEAEIYDFSLDSLLLFSMVLEINSTTNLILDYLKTFKEAK